MKSVKTVVKISECAFMPPSSLWAKPQLWSTICYQPIT